MTQKTQNGLHYLPLDRTPNPCYDIRVMNNEPLMMITRNALTELQQLQEDVAEHFADENIVSGELYWTCVEALATAKLAELRGELVA